MNIVCRDARVDAFLVFITVLIFSFSLYQLLCCVNTICNYFVESYYNIQNIKNSLAQSKQLIYLNIPTKSPEVETETDLDTEPEAEQETKTVDEPVDDKQ